MEPCATKCGIHTVGVDGEVSCSGIYVHRCTTFTWNIKVHNAEDSPPANNNT